MKLRDKPCETCNWRYPGFHVCLDPNKPVEPRIVKKYENIQMHSMTPQERAQRSRVAAETRWAKHREKVLPRDKKIIEVYKQDEKGMKTISREFGIAFQTVRNVLLRAQSRGEVVIRERGGRSNVARLH